jgi:hypothetical protein
VSFAREELMRLASPLERMVSHIRAMMAIKTAYSPTSGVSHRGLT